MKGLIIGIDISSAKNKRLPLSAIYRDENGSLEVIEVAKLFTSPRGKGNRSLALDSEKDWSVYISQVIQILKNLEQHFMCSILKIVIDAPLAPAITSLGRDGELEMAKEGIPFFKTHDAEKWKVILLEASDHLRANPKGLYKIPYANTLWMRFGFEISKTLSQIWPCIETYPNAILRQIGSFHHKSTSMGKEEQKNLIYKIFGKEIDLANSGFGSFHDKIDSLLCAWVGTLDVEQLKVYGKLEPIYVPNLDTIPHLKGISDISQAFQLQYEEYVSSRIFSVNRSLLSDKDFLGFGGDESISRLLSFKGTGVKKTFKEVQLEYADYVEKWWQNLWAGNEATERLWIDSFVMSRNYNVVYEEGDITLTGSQMRIPA